MEETKANVICDKDVKTSGDDGWGSGCPFWFLGNEKSADADLKEKFEVAEDEKD